ncbi:hypothetical protein Tco_1275598 [Tanacetum coccineum]
MGQWVVDTIQSTTSKSRQARVGKQESASKSRQARVGKQESASKRRQARVVKQESASKSRQEVITRKQVARIVPLYVRREAKYEETEQVVCDRDRVRDYDRMSRDRERHQD